MLGHRLGLDPISSYALAAPGAASESARRSDPRPATGPMAPRALRGSGWLQGSVDPRSRPVNGDPLVNQQFAMDHHHFHWINYLTMAILKFAPSVCLPEGIGFSCHYVGWFPWGSNYLNPTKVTGYNIPLMGPRFLYHSCSLIFHDPYLMEMELLKWYNSWNSMEVS